MKLRELDLDFVRGVAILLAMGWHFNHSDSSNYIVLFLLLPGQVLGWTGVDLFFVLSGFLVGRLVAQEVVNTGTFNSRRFLIRRAFKLWPILYIFLLILLVQFPAERFLWQIGLHVQNYFRTPVATHLWSLAVEEHFYLAFAVLVPLWASCGANIRLASIAVGFAIVSPLLFRIVATTQGVDAVLLQTQTHYRLDALACGVGLALLAVYRPGVIEAIQRQRIALLTGLFAGIIFLSTVSKTSALGTSLGFTVSYVTGAILLLLIWRSGIEHMAPKLIQPVALLGVFSYGIYIWHVPAGRAIEAVARAVGPGWPPILTVALSYISAIALGFLATKLIERPFLNLRDRLFPTL